MVCRWCGARAFLNPTLRISFCELHGFASPLDACDLHFSRVDRGTAPDGYATNRAGGSWAIPAG